VPDKIQKLAGFLTMPTLYETKYPNMKILALSGSLRKESYNTAAIKALKILAPSHVEITVGSVGDVPLFNPDRVGENIPALEELTNSLKISDGLVIASPEYAHGISGPMKNALDWLVSSVEFPNKPVMLINTSPRATHGQEALSEVLATMSANVIEGSCIGVPLMSSEQNIDGIVGSEEISNDLRDGLMDFCSEIENLEIEAQKPNSK
jgi:chromate reductase